MENARDSFYLVLRNQLTVVNPLRVVVIRGVQRPGILVEENENPVAMTEPDVFVLRWTELALDKEHALPLAAQTCEFHYWTEGTSTNGGLDRGRLMSQMDADLVQILAARNAPKQNFATTPALALATKIFWTDAVFGPDVTTKNRLSRVAKVTLYSYEEAADL
jgi:hypothetical protein